MLYRQRRSEADKKLWPHLHPFTDRHGKRRCYYRYKGRSVPITADPVKQPELFKAQYEAARDGKPMPIEPDPGAPKGRHPAGTWNAAIDDYLGTSKYAVKADNTKKAYQPWIDLLRAVVGDELMKNTTRWSIFKLHDEVVKSDRKPQANTFLSVLSNVIHVGKIRDWLKDDLLIGIEHQEVESNSHRPYTQDEVEAWRSTYPIGTMARAAFEFVYQFALSRAELIVLSPAHITGGVLWITRVKTGAPQVANVYGDPIMCEVLEAFPQADDSVVNLQGRATMPFLRNRSGRPWLSSAFGKQWRRWAEAAGLPSDFTIHGGRSTFVTDAMDTGVANQDAMRVTGHLDERVFSRVYGKKHNKERAAARAQKAVLAERQKRAAALKVVA
jgi:integrase